MLIRLSDIEAESSNRPSGYREDILKAGTIQGKLLRIEQDKYAELVRKYQSGRFSGLGDVIKWLTDKLSIQQCQSCKERQRRLNELFPL